MICFVASFDARFHCLSYVCADDIGFGYVKSMQRSGTDAIRTQIQPSKLKLKKLNLYIVKIQRENMATRVSSYLPKGGHSATKTELKII